MSPSIINYSPSSGSSITNINRCHLSKTRRRRRLLRGGGQCDDCYSKRYNNKNQSSIGIVPQLIITMILLTTKMTNKGGVTVVRGSWIDPDTDERYYTTSANTIGDDRDYELVFSDEFEVDDRSFADGDDPRWTALDKNDYTNDALHFYRPSNAHTKNGMLNITTTFRKNSYVAFDEDLKKKYVDTKHIQSAMLQGWNKFCFTGGIVEISARLPGKATTGGLWPALWLMGNLARATYIGSSNYMWPWSYDTCDPENRDAQEINACDATNHYGLASHVGRGAPEIDILEAMPGEPGPLPNTGIERPYFSASLQIAPGVRNHRPQLGFLPRKGSWYEGLEYGNVTNSSLNPFFYGVTLVHKPKSYTYQSDALSANMNINASHFETHHKYRVEWNPPSPNYNASEGGDGGYIKWYCDDELVYGIRANTLSSLTKTVIPSEPMYVLLNTAVSSSWGFPKPCPEGCDCDCYVCGDADCDCGLPEGFCENIPAGFEIDYVRVYQPTEGDGRYELGCSTERRPTDLFIEGHRERYMREGDREMLRDVVKGGMMCRTHEDCGGGRQRRGRCALLTKNKTSGQSGDGGGGGGVRHCVCDAGWTGPRCLAHDASYDDVAFKSRPSLDELHIQSITIPLNLLITLGLMISLLLTMVVADVHRKRKQQYEQDMAAHISHQRHQSRLYSNAVLNFAMTTNGTNSKDFDPYVAGGYNNSHMLDATTTTSLIAPHLAPMMNNHHDYYDISLQRGGLNNNHGVPSTSNGATVTNDNGSYQNGESFPSPPESQPSSTSGREKVISYCIIDGRLM